MSQAKSYSIIIVPSDHSGTRQYRISRVMLFVLVALVAVFTVTFVVFAATYSSVLMEARRAGDLERENASLRQQVERVDVLSRELEAMSGLRAQVVRLLGRDVGDELPVLPETTSDEPTQVLRDVDRLQQIFADAARDPFAPRDWPTSGAVRREFVTEGDEDVDDPHTGLSLDPSPDGLVRAAGRGRVVRATFEPDRGHVVLLDHGYGFRTRYERLERLLVSTGQSVDQGQPIAERAGSSGDDPEELGGGTIVPGTLYFELLVDGTPVDPRGYLDRR